MSDVPETAILEMTIESPAYRLSPVGIEFLAELDHQGWLELGTKLGNAGRSIGFLIGDWLNYGDGKVREGLYPKCEGGVYHEAIKITELDYQTLANYANVARKVPRYLRKERLSFEHHRKIAPLKTEEEKEKWLRIAEKEREKNGKTMSSRRLAKSILLGRVAKVEEMSVPENDRGIDNMCPHVTRIVVLWGKFKRSGFLENADAQAIEDMLSDLQPVLEIAQELREALAESGGMVSGSHAE